jgi:hypothetical protein
MQGNRAGSFTIVGDQAFLAGVAAVVAHMSSSEDGRRLLGEISRGGPPALAHEATLERDGQSWTIAYEGTLFKLKDTKGLRFLERLLTNPGIEFHVGDLNALAGDEDTPEDHLGDAGEMLDARARTEYRRRLEDLRSQLEEAVGFNDLDRAARLRQEIDFLGNELARAVGLGGRNRKASSAVERTRLNVTRAIRTAIDRIEQMNRRLGSYLASRVKTGVFCSYTSDPRAPIDWRIDRTAATAFIEG